MEDKARKGLFYCLLTISWQSEYFHLPLKKQGLERPLQRGRTRRGWCPAFLFCLKLLRKAHRDKRDARFERRAGEQLFRASL